MGNAFEVMERWEERLCLILLASIPILYGLVGAISRLQISLLLVFILWLITFTSRRPLLPIHRHEIPIILMLIWAALSSMWTVNISSTAGYIGNLLVGLGIYLAFRSGGIKAEKAVYLLIGVAALVAIYGIYQRLWIFGRIMDLLKGGAFPILPEREAMIERVGSGRVFSTFMLPGLLGGYMASSIALGLGLVADLISSGRKGKPLLLAVASLALMFLCLSLTMSFGGWLSLIISISSFFIVVGGKWKRLAIYSFLCALVLLIVLLLVRGGEVMERGRSPWGQRVMNWKAALRIFADRPVLGTGAGTFGDIYVRYKDPQANEVRDAHNTFLQMASELGAPGAIFFSAFVVMSLLYAVRNCLSSPLRAGLLCCFIALLSHNFVDLDWFVPEPQWLLWAVLGLIAGMDIQAGPGISSLPDLAKRVGIISVVAFLSLIPIIRFGMASVHFEAGEEAIWAGDLEKAHEEFSKAASLNPLNGRYHAASAYSLFLMIKAGKAPKEYISKVVDGYERAARSSPTSASFRAFLAELYLALGNLEKARENAELAFKNYPSKRRYKELLDRVKGWGR
jgi:O-antigen ligase